MVQDHVDPGLLFVGTEFGVFFTTSGGDRWTKLSGGVPNIPFRDLAIQKRENDLVGATFGRSFFILDDYTPLRGMSEELLEREAELFPVREADWYLQRRPLGGAEKASQGGAFFTAPNPPFGALFTYYLKEPIRKREEARRASEKELEQEGKDTPYPGWEELRRESEEKQPVVLLTVLDTDGARRSPPDRPGDGRIPSRGLGPAVPLRAPLGAEGPRKGTVGATGFERFPGRPRVPTSCAWAR